jgi:hypothetical protein
MQQGVAVIDQQQEENDEQGNIDVLSSYRMDMATSSENGDGISSVL